MNVLIIEDETLLAKELEATIAEVDTGLKVIDILPSLKTARRWFMEHPEPDLIFMDIQLSDGISFSLFDDFKINCPVVFTTAYDQYAVKAFKVNGVDYLLKPIVKAELKNAIEKCKTILESKTAYPTDIKLLIQTINQQHTGINNLYKEKFMVHARNQWMPVNTKDIACFYKENLHYLYTFSGERHILNFETMEEIESLLNPAIFYRANRQCILNIDAIQSIKPQENAKLTVFFKSPLKMQTDVSRDKAPEFRKWVDR
ncbi:MAG: LytTR family DNA-binding domain-containing protein [Ferruginibacter sp.]